MQPVKNSLIRLRIARIGLIAWLLLLVKFILFKHQWYVIQNYFRDEFPFYTLSDGWEKANLVPFRNIFNILVHQQDYQFWIGNISGNIGGFVPIGFLFPLTRYRPTSFRRALLFCLILSLFFEWMQGILGTGIMDVDDLILNTLGGIIGFGIYRILFPALRPTAHQNP